MNLELDRRVRISNRKPPPPHIYQTKAGISNMQKHPAADRLLEQFAMHPLTNDERITSQSMLLAESSSRILVMPTHHINEMGDMMGFRFTCNAFAGGHCLPVVRTMFHGHTLVECGQADEGLIMRLMSEPARNRERMRAFLCAVEEACTPASLECVPENASSLTQHGTLEATGLITVDSHAWTPEVPERIGIYHAYIRGFNRDVRTHRLFIVCSGGMARASDAFCNLVIDAGKNCTAQEVCDSQEAWWLRKGCQRARCRLIKLLADAFEIPVRHMQVPPHSSFRFAHKGAMAYPSRSGPSRRRMRPMTRRRTACTSPYENAVDASQSGDRVEGS